MECTATPYDAVNRLVSVDGGATASYAYDYANRRVKKVNWEGSTHYIWEGSQVIAEHNASTGVQIIDYVYAGNRLIAKGPGSQLAGNGNMTYVLSDRLSARVLMDTFGTVTGRQGHLPFGEEFAVSGTLEKHRFTSYEQDSETGTDYAVNRQYAQGVGRFMRTDPYRRSYEFENPQSLNRYAYIGNDPINSIDPLGLCGSVTLLPGGGVRVCYPVGVDGCYCDDFLMPIDEGQRKERIKIIVVEKNVL